MQIKAARDRKPQMSETSIAPNASSRWFGAALVVGSAKFTRRQTKVSRRATKKGGGSDDEAQQAVLETGCMEIQQQADADMAHVQISQNLRLMGRGEGRNALDF